MDFEIAEEDLKLRGPGELLGQQQSGLPPLRFADFGGTGNWSSKPREIVRESLTEKNKKLHYCLIFGRS